MELSGAAGAPGRGCSRTAVLASGASSGNCAVTSTGRGVVVLTISARYGPRAMPPREDLGHCRGTLRGQHPLAVQPCPVRTMALHRAW
jgi:hypothetical protein